MWRVCWINGEYYTEEREKRVGLIGSNIKRSGKKSVLLGNVMDKKGMGCEQ